MKLKEKILKVAGSKYKCLECEQMDGVDVITIGKKDNDRLVLNYEITNESISVNVVDKTVGAVVEEYTAEFASDADFESKLKTSVSTFEAIVKAGIKADDIKTETPNVDMNERFNDILENGKIDDMRALTEDEMKAFEAYLDGINAPKLFRDALSKELKSATEPTPVVNVTEGIIPNVTSSDEALLTEATMTQLLEALIETLSVRVESEEDDVITRVLEDIGAQAEGMLDELAQVVSE